jgi:hypothetical protein
MPGGFFPCRANYYGTFYLQRITASCGYAKYESIERAKNAAAGECNDYSLLPRFRLIMNADNYWLYSLQFIYVDDPFAYQLGTYTASGMGLPPTCMEPIELTYLPGSGTTPGFIPPGVITLTPIIGGLF